MRMQQRHRQQYRRRVEASGGTDGGGGTQLFTQLAEAMDQAPEWTLDQLVGLVFGGLLLTLYLSSSQLDIFVARAQRRKLGLCEQCGGLYSPASCTEKGCPMRRTASNASGDG